MLDEYKTELIEFINRSLDNIGFGRAERITASFKYKGVEVYIDMKTEDEQN